MDLQPLLDWGLSFYHRYPEFCYVAAGVLVLLALWKPFKVLRAACVMLVLAVLVYIGFFLINSMNVGIKVKDKAIHRTEKALE